MTPQTRRWFLGVCLTVFAVWLVTPGASDHDRGDGASLSPEEAVALKKKEERFQQTVRVVVLVALGVVLLAGLVLVIRERLRERNTRSLNWRPSDANTPQELNWHPLCRE